MIVKTNNKTMAGKDIYHNVLNGEEGVLAKMNFQPSERKEMRKDLKHMKGMESYSKIIKTRLQVEAERKRKLKKLKKQLGNENKD